MVHGLPELVHSYNGPQFVSKTFNDFAAECGFRHTTSSPHFHQANCLAERAVQAAKKLLELEDPMMGLLDYRKTGQFETSILFEIKVPLKRKACASPRMVTFLKSF